jgi:hypothetical protein
MREALKQTLSIPERQRAQTRRAMALTGLCIAAAGLGSAAYGTQFARSHAGALANAAPAPPVPAVFLPPSPAATPATPPPVATPIVVAAMPSPVPATGLPPLREARAIAKARSGDPSALERWARSAFHAGELREARRAASAWALRDGTVEPRIFMAQVLDASGRHAEAATTLSEWLESHPDSTDARVELARLSGGHDPRELARR